MSVLERQFEHPTRRTLNSRYILVVPYVAAILL